VANVAASLRSGASPDVAWRRGLDVAVRSGLPVREDLSERAGDPRVAAAVVAAAQVARDLGAAPGTVLDGVVVALVQDAEAQAARASALAGPVATARLLEWLPVVGLVLGIALGVDPVAVLLDGGGGTALLLTGAAASFVGHRWTARLVRGARRSGAEP